MSQSGSERDSRPQKLIEKIKQKIENNEKFFSLEFYPPKTFNGATNLMAIIGRINENCTPLFCDITWKPSQDPMSDTCQEPSTLLISAAAVDLYGQNVMIHIPSGSTTKSQVLEHLMRAKELGIGSVLAVKGDAVRDDSSAEREDGFDYTVDLVRFIRSEFGDHFTVGVAGYLMGSSDITSYEEDLKHLKAEVEAGADLIITQMFFEVKTFHKFVEDCHNCGINVPMIPAIFPIQSFHSLRQLKRSSRVEIPQHLFDALAPMKDDSAAVMNFGIKYAAQMCKELFEGGHVHGLHFYTLNREIFLTEVLQKIGMYLEEDDSNIPNLPWMQGPAQVRRAQEELVRPIFWASRPRSYMIRTTNWEEFPNGRWGDSSAASFGQLKDYHLILFGTHKSKEELLNMWGRELDSQSQVFDIFVCYVTGKENKHGFKVKELPWNDEELAPETLQFVDKLSHLNQRGILTINSQPNVNAVPSTDPVVGWGQPGGYVFQKAYLEFFTSEEIAMSLYDVLQEFPMVNYHIVNCSGKDDVTNANVYSSNAVTWGVFPGSEIIQPTVVDPIAFQFWKDEAFALWNHQWGSIYPEKSKSREIIDTIHDTYYLVNLVDNDYVAGNRLFDILDTVLTKLGKI